MLSHTTFRVLALCAGVPGNPAVSARLRQEIAGLLSWDDFARGAGDHGLEPLVLAHLGDADIGMPAEVGDRLRIRWTQHARAYAVRTRVVLELARDFDAESIPFLVLKGAALAHLVFANPLLRPMRDVDVLVRKCDARRAYGMLRCRGFSPGPPAAPGHHHLTAMSRTVDGAMVTIELHQELLPPTPFLKPPGYERLYRSARSFTWAGVQLSTLGAEDMLWHVYAHAFSINVLRPEIRLISVADLVTATEMWVGDLDWARLRREHGALVRALPLLDLLRPWSLNVRETFGRTASAARSSKPWVRSKAVRGVRPIASPVTWADALKRDVLWPPEWWFRMRYGIQQPGSWLWYRFAGHPARLLLAAAAAARRRLRDGSIA